MNSLSTTLGNGGSSVGSSSESQKQNPASDVLVLLPLPPVPLLPGEETLEECKKSFKIEELEKRLNKLKEELPMFCATEDFPIPPSCGSPSPQSQGKSLEQRLDSLRKKRD